jgi:cytochrome c
MRLPLTLAVLALVLGGGLLFRPAPASGDAASDALAAAVKAGEALWNKTYGTGSKSCAECHKTGPNAMKGSRLKSYPKFDKTLNKVVTGQQKINQMLVDKSKGTALELGSDELNALEAYAATLR